MNDECPCDECRLRRSSVNVTQPAVVLRPDHLTSGWRCPNCGRGNAPSTPWCCTAKKPDEVRK